MGLWPALTQIERKSPFLVEKSNNTETRLDLLGGDYPRLWG